MKAFIYYFGLITSYLFNLLLFKTKVFYEDEQKQNKRIKGKAIVIANHQNPLDALVIANQYFFRRLNYIAAKFKGTKRALIPLVLISGGVLVDREAYSFDFLEACKRLLHKNKLVLVFPEGRFSFEYEPRRFIYSYVVLAIQSGAPIVPIASDCGYGFFKRVHILIGNRIDLSPYGAFEHLTKEKLKEINESVYQKYLRLYYLLKKKKYEKFRGVYSFQPPNQGDMIRISLKTHYHYGVYVSGDEVIQFGAAINDQSEKIVVNAVSMGGFCGDKIPEVRVLSAREKRHRRETGDIVQYARLCLGQEGYHVLTNNCFDFATRVIFK